MRKFLSVLITILSFLICGCSRTSQSSVSEIASMDYNVFYPIENVTICIPSEYSETEGKYGVKYFSKDDATITVTSEDVGSNYTNAYDYSFHALEEYSDSFDEIKDLNEYQIKVNGLECCIKQFRYVVNGETSSVERYCYIGFILKNSKAYIISCVSITETFFDNKAGFEYALNSFEITSD